ncbi:glycosyl transferase family 1 [Neisseria meningitidis]|nr:glycosyl transferase family 1 [Neisseria meningitidis]MBG8597595.1 glycosyl transferase family 1 [Neisseria meningitidis]MBG8627976.1 glycosyl transferase family 1 [Neisseria meningitidis]MBG8633407.1 glycosyl transferase family 1 [Neisseria meningitidis]MBG8660503.1 glycosyl transferase family 1 [Neisseria meningitidis]
MIESTRPSEKCFSDGLFYSGLTKIRTRRRSRRQYK